MLLIDGYNLLHATDLFGQGAAAGTLQGSREALLAFLARVLSARERKQTTIVFDATGAPPGLPAVVPWDSMTAQFARGYDDADALIEEIIEQHPAPKSLVVVSGDRRVQRAARHRGAKVVESQAWFEALRRRKQPTDRPSEAKSAPIEDADYWVERFSGVEELGADSQRTRKAGSAEEFDNPFPHGYGEEESLDE